MKQVPIEKQPFFRKPQISCLNKTAMKVCPLLISVFHTMGQVAFN